VKIQFDGNTGSELRFALQIELDSTDRYQNVIDVFGVAVIDAMLSENIRRCRERLKVLRQPGPGWQDDAGGAADARAVAAPGTLLLKPPSGTDPIGQYDSSFGDAGQLAASSPLCRAPTLVLNDREVLTGSFTWNGWTRQLVSSAP
jgi:hypothetical protein